MINTFVIDIKMNGMTIDMIESDKAIIRTRLKYFSKVTHVGFEK
jgi:hypothetical protein